MGGHSGASPIEPTGSESIQRQQETEGAKQIIAQEASEDDFKSFAAEAAFDPVMMNRNFDTIEEKMRKQRAAKEKPAGEDASAIEKVQEISEELEKKNHELRARTLRELREQINTGDSARDVFQKTMDAFNDHTLANEALKFLEQTAKEGTEKQIKAAREELNNSFGREVRAGKNMGPEARAFSKTGLDTPTGLRDLYRDITGNPREVTDLFSELHEKFSFDKMETTIDFLLSSLGADLKAQGPSIPRGQLYAMMTDARNLLAILWVYKFFRGRMDLIKASYQRGGMLMPRRVTFEMLANLFVQFLKERYPSMDKVFQMAIRLGVSAELAAQIILFTQMRDAVRGVAPKLFRSPQHRHDVLIAYLEALEELEETLEQEGEEEEEEKEEEEEE